MAAIAASLGAEKSAIFGKMVVVDTVCAYTWLGVLIAGASGGLLAFLWLWYSPLRRLHRLPDPCPTPPDERDSTRDRGTRSIAGPG